METSKPSLRISFDGDFLKQLRLLEREEHQIIGKAINDVSAAWGQPHLHAGTGLRKLREKIFECRSGLKTRLVFELLADGSLYFHLMGNHDEIRRFLKLSR